jgi:hypothetical protein
VRAPSPDLGGLRLANPLDTNVDALTHVRGVGAADDHPLAGLVSQAIAGLEINRAAVYEPNVISDRVPSIIEMIDGPPNS